MAERGPLAALGLLAVGLLLPGLLTGPSLDAAVFVHAAGEIRDGGTLYVDVWDHKPPGAILLLAGIQWLLPFVEPWLTSWTMSVTVTVATGWLVARILLSLGVRHAAAWLAAGATVTVMGQYLMALGGGLTEPMATALLAGGLLLALREEGRARLVLAGALASGAVLVSIPGAVGAAIVATIAVLTAERRQRAGLLVAVGLAAPAALTAAWLAATGALAASIDAVIGYAAAYRASNASTGLDLSSAVASWTLLALLFVVVPALIGSIPALRRGHPGRRLVAACLGWIAISVILFVYQGRFFAHYAVPLAIPLGVLAGLGLERLASSPAPQRTIARIARIAPLVAGLIISVVASVVAGTMEWTPIARQHERVDLAAPVVRDLTEPGDAIWVWGTVPQLYLAADRETATSYGYLYPLVTPGYTSAAMIAATRDDLVADPPALIVDAGSSEPGAPGFVPLLIPRPVANDGRDLDLLDPLRAFVRERYAAVEAVGGWVVYRLRNGP